MKKHNPTDATMRNVKALNKKIVTMKADIRWLKLRTARLTKIINRRFDLDVK